MLLLHISKFGTDSSHGLRENMFTARQPDRHTQTEYNNPPVHARGLITSHAYRATRPTRERGY